MCVYMEPSYNPTLFYREQYSAGNIADLSVIQQSNEGSMKPAGLHPPVVLTGFIR